MGATPPSTTRIAASGRLLERRTEDGGGWGREGVLEGALSRKERSLSRCHPAKERSSDPGEATDARPRHVMARTSDGAGPSGRAAPSRSLFPSEQERKAKQRSAPRTTAPPRGVHPLNSDGDGALTCLGCFGLADTSSWHGSGDEEIDAIVEDVLEVHFAIRLNAERAQWGPQVQLHFRKIGMVPGARLGSQEVFAAAPHQTQDKAAPRGALWECGDI